MLEAIISGESHPLVLAQHAWQKLHANISALERAVTRNVGPHQHFVLAKQLAHIAFLNAAMERLALEIAARLQPVEEVVEPLQVTHGVGRRTSEPLVAEIGVELERFTTAAHPASWAALCPPISKVPASRAAEPSGVAIPVAVCPGGSGAWHAQSKNTYLATQYRKLASRRGPKNATVAVATTFSSLCTSLWRGAAPMPNLAPLISSTASAEH
jgi:transposase